ncbi:MAG: hypothetical protein LBR79_06700 [Oscillospiraceae bacterium]|nr:hypothetical protein [Oscillospiraceae bacterium]
MANKETGIFLPIPYPARIPFLTAEKFEEVKLFVAKNPDATFDEIIEELSLPIHKSRLYVLFIEAGLSFKKRALHPKVQQREDVQQKCKEWRENQKKLDISKLKFLDESSVNCGMTKLYGCAPTNKE